MEQKSLCKDRDMGAQAYTQLGTTNNIIRGYIQAKVGLGHGLKQQGTKTDRTQQAQSAHSSFTCSRSSSSGAALPIRFHLLPRDSFGPPQSKASSTAVFITFISLHIKEKPIQINHTCFMYIPSHGDILYLQTRPRFGSILFH